MIFVTVGNSIKGVEFYRLIREMDDVARDLKEDVVAQIGFIEDPPRHIRSFSYLGYVEIQNYFQQASMIVGHCGVGTVINALMHKKPIILVPRSKAYGEHIDEHQFELANKLKGMGGIFIVDDLNRLKETILHVKALLETKQAEPSFSQERGRLLSFIRMFVRRCANERLSDG
jgi:exopolysaccharide biosynthesis glucuronosyltransferase PssE